MKRSILFLLLLQTGFAAISFALEIPVKDSQGRALTIELVSLTGDKVAFRRVGAVQEYNLPLDRFDADSQEIIKKEAADLPPVLPKIEIDVSIGKRRVGERDSYYMVRQDITTSIKIRNLSLAQALPEVNAKVIHFGQDRRNSRDHRVMSVQEFKIQLAPGATSNHELEAFETRFDSDNKGYGNIGGVQYFGYLLLVTDEKDNLVMFETTAAAARRALTESTGVHKTFATYKTGLSVKEDLLTPNPAR